MIKGDRIKLVKSMGAFTNVGEVCEVIDVAEDGVISFRFGGVHLGCMSYNEYEKYFEKVDYVEEKNWTEWDKDDISFYDLNDEVVTIEILYRDNGRKVQVKYDSYRAESTCHKVDIFDFGKGFELAIKRLIVKYLDGQVKMLAVSM